MNSALNLRASFLASVVLPLVLWEPSPSLAQEADKDRLEEIVVTATRSEKTVREAARSVSVVDRERIQDNTQQLALDEVLAGIPGLFLQNRYNFAQDLRLSLRGFGARSNFGIRGIKIIVDGIPETLPDGQASVDSIDLGSARRIEILRGPSSSLYGNASGGVIAIESDRGEEPTLVQTVLGTGGLGFEKLQLKIAARSARADYLLNVTTQKLDGYRDHSETKGTLVNGRFGLRVSDSDLLTLVFNDTDQPTANDPGGITKERAMSNPRSANQRNVLFDVGEALDQQRVGIVYERLRPSGNLSLRNHYVWRDFSNRLPFEAGGTVDLQRFFWGVGAQYTFGGILPRQAELTVGIDIDRQDDDRRRFDNVMGIKGPLGFDQREQVESNGVFGQGQVRLTDAWTLSGGLRYDEVTFEIADRYLVDGDDSGKIRFDHVSPSVALSFDFGRGMVFGAISSSFETPTTTELANPDGSGGFNRDLRPQTAVNYELGFKTTRAHLTYELSLFHITLEDELIPFELPAFPGRTFFSNAGKSSRAGIETALSWTSRSGFGVDASYTWSDFRFDEFVDDAGNDYSGSRLPGLPERFGYLGLRYRSNHGLTVTLETILSGLFFADNANSVEVPSSLVSGVRAGYEFERGPWTIRPYVGVNNLFDERYSSNVRINAFGGAFYEPAPGRHAYAGLAVAYRRDVD